MHKILIVDDEPDLLETLADLIDGKLSGCEIEKATNGLDAFILAQQSKYDLIITDHKMPFMTGAALVIGVRSRENKNSETPIIMVSAFIDLELKRKLEIQNVGFVEKPFTPNDFIEIVRTYLI